MITENPIVQTLESRRSLKLKKSSNIQLVESKITKYNDYDEINREDFECAICLCFIAEPVVTPCQHIFCISCLEQWLRVKDECPMCKMSQLYFGPAVIKNLQKFLQSRYEEEFEARKSELIEQKLWTSDKKITNFVFVNDWEEIRNPTIVKQGIKLKNRYTICFKTIDNSDIIDEVIDSVEITYPARFKNSVRTLNKENGWKLTDLASDQEKNIVLKVEVKLQTWTKLNPIKFQFLVMFEEKGNIFHVKTMLDLEDKKVQKQIEKSESKTSINSQIKQSLKEAAKRNNIRIKFFRDWKR